jgi:hypothetical protein
MNLTSLSLGNVSERFDVCEEGSKQSRDWSKYKCEGKH